MATVDVHRVDIDALAAAGVTVGCDTDPLMCLANWGFSCSFLNVDVRFSNACGVRSSGSVVCWGYKYDRDTGNLAIRHLADMDGDFIDVNWRGQALTARGAVVPIVFFDELPSEYKMSWHLPSIVYQSLGPWIQQWGH